MEGNNSGSTHDLQAILATLAQFSNPPPNNNWNPSQNGHDTLNLNNYLASQEIPQPSNTQAPVVEKTQDPRIRPQARNAPSPKPMVDPATITTWQEGLRCVTKIASQNASFAASIRKMMDDQRSHEMRWYAERQALKQTQATRSSSVAKAQSILQSLSNGMPSTSTSTPSGTDPQVELAEFDRKIYAAQQSMEVAMVGELKGLGVPFFGTDQSLVVADDRGLPDNRLPEGQPKWSPLVTETEMLELRRKMVGHLEDLYRD